MIAFLTKLFISACGIGFGAVILKYRKTVFEWTGRMAWAETYLGSGGTFTVITLTGFLLIGLSVTYLFGGLDGIGTRSLTDTHHASSTPALGDK